MEKRDNALLVENISFLAHEGSLHLVNRLLEELFVLSDQEFLDALEAALALSDRIDLNAFDENLNERCRLREFSPSKRQTVE